MRPRIDLRPLSRILQSNFAHINIILLIELTIMRAALFDSLYFLVIFLLETSSSL